MENTNPNQTIEQHRLLIPTIGTELKLEVPWAFVLPDHYRNRKFHETLKDFKLLGTAAKIKQEGSRHYGGNDTLAGNEVVFPAGTILKVARIYIRNGVSAFDSVTFTIKKGNWPGQKKVSGRFFVKLYDVNRIVCSFDPRTIKIDSKVSLLTQLAAAAYDPKEDGPK